MSIGTRTIALTNSDKVVLIDATNYEQVSQYRWFLKHASNGRYYVAHTIRTGKKFTTIWLHRFIMQAKDGFDIHHRDGNKLNCRRLNLESIKHNAHGIEYYGAEARTAEEYAERNCTEQEWENR